MMRRVLSLKGDGGGEERKRGEGEKEKERGEKRGGRSEVERHRTGIREDGGTIGAGEWPAGVHFFKIKK